MTNPMSKRNLFLTPFEVKPLRYENMGLWFHVSLFVSMR